MRESTRRRLYSTGWAQAQNAAWDTTMEGPMPMTEMERSLRLLAPSVREAITPVPPTPPAPMLPASERPDLDPPKISIDFDGVIHRGPHGLPGYVEGDLIQGAAAGLKALSARYRVIVLTARTDFGAVRKWLDDHGVGKYVTEVTNIKPPAAAYIDDRALHFTDWPTAVAAADPSVAMKQRVTTTKVPVLDPVTEASSYKAPSTTPLDKAGTAPHLLDTVLHDLAHATQHAKRLTAPDVKGEPQSVQFNAEHTLNHLQGALDHAKKLDAHLGKNASDPKAWTTERTALKGMREALLSLPTALRGRLG